MAAILKSKHLEFSDWMKDAKKKQPVLCVKLDELEASLQFLFEDYQQKMQELKQIIEAYEEKRRAIRIEIKKNKKYNLV